MSSRRRSGNSALGALTSGDQAAPSRPGGIYSDLMMQMQEIDPALASQMVLHEDGAIQINSFRVTPIGLIGGDRATEKEWRQLGKTLFQLNDSVQIVIGDWLVQGERIHGKTYEQVAIEFDRKKKTLYNWKYVMSSVDISLRGETLTFKHYRIVAAMTYDTQAHWLGLAVENQWGAAKMQDEIDKAVPPPLRPAPRLQYSQAVLDAREMFNKRSERINRALDGKDDPDEETVWNCIQDIEAFTQALRKNFGWVEE